MIKKILAILVLVLSILFVFCGCGVIHSYRPVPCSRLPNHVMIDKGAKAPFSGHLIPDREFNWLLRRAAENGTLGTVSAGLEK